MKKLLLVLGATSMLVLSACHRATEDGVTSPSIPREQQIKETTNYFHYLADSYQKALSHKKLFRTKKNPRIQLFSHRWLPQLQPWKNSSYLIRLIKP